MTKRGKYVSTSLNEFASGGKRNIQSKKKKSAPLRDKVLRYLAENKRISKRKLRKLVVNLNESKGRNASAAASMWLKRNKKYLVKEERNGETYFKLSKLGRKYLNEAYQGKDNFQKLKEKSKINRRRKMNEEWDDEDAELIQNTRMVQDDEDWEDEYETPEEELEDESEWRESTEEMPVGNEFGEPEYDYDDEEWGNEEWNDEDYERKNHFQDTYGGKIRSFEDEPEEDFDEEDFDEDKEYDFIDRTRGKRRPGLWSATDEEGSSSAINYMGNKRRTRGQYESLSPSKKKRLQRVVEEARKKHSKNSRRNRLNEEDEYKSESEIGREIETQVPGVTFKSVTGAGDNKIVLQVSEYDDLYDIPREYIGDLADYVSEKRFDDIFTNHYIVINVETNYSVFVCMGPDGITYSVDSNGDNVDQASVYSYLEESSKRRYSRRNRLNEEDEKKKSKKKKKGGPDKYDEEKDISEEGDDEDDNKEENDELSFEDLDLDDEENGEGKESNFEDEESEEESEESEEKVEITDFVITVDDADKAIEELSDLGVPAEKVDMEAAGEEEEGEDLGGIEGSESEENEEEEEETNESLNEQDDEQDDEEDEESENEENNEKNKEEGEDFTELGNEEGEELDFEEETSGEQIKVPADYWETLQGWLEEKGVDVEEMFGGEIEVQNGEAVEANGEDEEDEEDGEFDFEEEEEEEEEGEE